MDSSRTAVTPGEKAEDLSALAWVHEELRRSLDAAHKALRRFVKETEALGESDVDTVRGGAEHSAERAAGRDRCAQQRVHLRCPPANDGSASRHAAGATANHQRRRPERHMDCNEL